MNEELIKQILAELASETGRAFGILITALSHQIDPSRLACDLRHYAETFARLDGEKKLSMRIAAECIAAAEEAARRQSPAKH